MSHVDIWGDAVPNWIAAVSAVGAFAAASVAGYFASKAAHWTKKQAEAADNQVTTQKEALALAQAQVDDARAETKSQRAEAVKTERRGEETRLDALAPSIFATAYPGIAEPNGGFGVEVLVGADDWKLLTHRGEFLRGANRARFRQSVRMTFENVSRVPARVDVTDHYGGELEYNGSPLVGGTPFWVRPGTKVEVVWRRTVSVDALVDGAGVFDPRSYLFYVEFLARDVNMNVGDRYMFGGRVMDVELDGTRVIVGPVPPEGWTDRVAQVRTRSYERLEAADAASVADAANVQDASSPLAAVNGGA